MSTCEFRFLSAGHPAPVHLTAGARPKLVEAAPHSPIGLGDDRFTESCLTLRPGDRLFLYSDGVVEASNPNEYVGQFGVERLLKVLNTTRSNSLEECLASLARSIADWCGNVPPHDDISVLAIEIPEASRAAKE
jgi:serine phosphatase RsbU (regulator of sigma subunit)